MPTQLILPDAAYQNSYNRYIEELGDEERYPFPMDFDHSNFPALLGKIEDFRQGRALPQGFVASTTFWLILENELVGVSNLRHEMPDSLKNYGGHIGLGIRPSYRGKGLGSHLLGLTVKEARKLGIGDVHVHCYKENQASANMIIACGGDLESEAADGEHLLQRYIIR